MLLNRFRWQDWVQIMLPIIVAGLFVGAIRWFQLYIPPIEIWINYEELTFFSALPILFTGSCFSLLLLRRRSNAYQHQAHAETKLQQMMATLNVQHEFATETLTQNYQQEVRRLENSKNEILHRFLENLDHELRNDLATLKSAWGNLGDIPNVAPSSSYRTGGIIIEKMRDLIMELQQISEIKDWILDEEINIIELVTEVVKICQVQITLSNRDIILDIPDESKSIWQLPSVLGDYGLLSRALRKLLENAVKYGRDENVFVTISEDRVSTQSFVKIEVIDKGWGIAKEDLPYIFEPLYRSKKHQDQIVGKGVGLALAAIIIKKHGGTIDPDSREGQGTKMIVRLPAYIAAHP